MSGLDQPLRDVVTQRYYDGRTFEEIARDKGIKTERARTMQHNAFCKLRHPNNAKYLRPFRDEIISARAYRGTGMEAFRRQRHEQRRAGRGVSRSGFSSRLDGLKMVTGLRATWRGRSFPSAPMLVFNCGISAVCSISFLWLPTVLSLTPNPARNPPVAFLRRFFQLLSNQFPPLFRPTAAAAPCSACGHGCAFLPACLCARLYRRKFGVFLGFRSLSLLLCGLALAFQNGPGILHMTRSFD